MAAPTAFSRAKKTRLKNEDLSKKGSIDEEILDLVNCINATDNFFTTSSCSGRIIVVSEPEESDEFITKKGCQWLYVSHKMANLASIENSLVSLQGSAVFKFEPFILHVQCRTLEDAKLMHVAAVESGFRNSGITIGKAGKVMVAVRSTHGLEVPLSDGPELLVSSQYLSFLVHRANAKLQENSKRIARFSQNLTQRLDNHTSGIQEGAAATQCRHCGRARARPSGLSETAQGTGGAGTGCPDVLKPRRRKGTTGSRTGSTNGKPASQTHRQKSIATSMPGTSFKDTQGKDTVTGEKASGSKGSYNEHPQPDSLESDDDNIVYGLDLLTMQA